MKRVLVVDDDAHIRAVTRFALVRDGYQVDEAADGREALRTIECTQPDLVVLDLLMPELDGLELCRRVRATSELPILMLSSRADTVDRIVGLELGADDYMVKPFSPRELVARVRGILRRAETREVPPTESLIRHGSLELDVDRHRCLFSGEVVPLTVTEFGLLRCLFGMIGKVYTREEIVERAYGAGHHITDRTIDSHIRRIREKFRALEADPVETVYGLGYRIRPEAHP